MPDLQTTYYILAIICMTISLILLIAIVVAVVVIRNKIISLENMVKDKLQHVTNTAQKAADIAHTVGEVVKAVRR